MFGHQVALQSSSLDLSSSSVTIIPHSGSKKAVMCINKSFDGCVFVCVCVCVFSVAGPRELVSPCLAPDYSGQWEHADALYTVKGQKAGMKNTLLYVQFHLHSVLLPRIVSL